MESEKEVPSSRSAFVVFGMTILLVTLGLSRPVLKLLFSWVGRLSLSSPRRKKVSLEEIASIYYRPT